MPPLVPPPAVAAGAVFFWTTFGRGDTWVLSCPVSHSLRSPRRRAIRADTLGSPGPSRHVIRTSLLARALVGMARFQQIAAVLVLLVVGSAVAVVSVLQDKRLEERRREEENRKGGVRGEGG